MFRHLILPDVIIQTVPGEDYTSLSFSYFLSPRSKYGDHGGRAVQGTRSNVGIVGSNLTQGMDICVGLFCVCIVLCVQPFDGLILRPKSRTDSVKDQKPKIGQSPRNSYTAIDR
jgi:hypothetical protein